VTEKQARWIANAILASAAVAAAVVIIRTPRLRHIVANASRMWLGGQNVPAYLAAEAGRAWTESGRDIMSR
jgi:hypothetical protein